MDYKLTFEDKPNRKDIHLLQQGLDQFNEKKLEQRPNEFAFYLRDDKNNICGGIYALSYSDSIHIILLWIDEKIRSQGYGSSLLKAVEAEGIKRRCRYVFVDTFGFQGEDFYLKNGYQVVGEIENVLLEQSKIFFKKNLGRNNQQKHVYKYDIQLINPILAEEICRDITETLPEYFGIPEANERYAKGVLERISFAGSVQNNYVGMLTLEFPFSNNANIYWLAVKENYQNQGIGSNLVKAAEDYCNEHNCFSLTVETLSPKEKDENYLKTYQFYERLQFKPLFELHTYGTDFLMIYMQKILCK